MWGAQAPHVLQGGFKMTTKHTISLADEIYKGKARNSGYNPTDKSRRTGILMSHLHNHKFLTTAAAAPEAGDGNEIFSSYATPSLLSASGGNWIPLATGTLATAGATVINFDVPRNILIRTSAADAVNVKVHGLDVYGKSMAETISTSGGAYASGQRCFKSISKMYATAGLTAANVTSIGIGNRLGVPFHLQTTDQVVQVNVDGKCNTSGATGAYTIFAGASSATTITTSNGDADVRGSILFATPAPNGTRRLTALLEVDASSDRKGFGPPQVSSCTNG